LCFQCRESDRTAYNWLNPIMNDNMDSLEMSGSPMSAMCKALGRCLTGFVAPSFLVLIVLMPFLGSETNTTIISAYLVGLTSLGAFAGIMYVFFKVNEKTVRAPRMTMDAAATRSIDVARGVPA